MKTIAQTANPIAIKRSPAKPKLANSNLAKPTPWAKDFFKRVDRLREALGDTKLV